MPNRLLSVREKEARQEIIEVAKKCGITELELDSILEYLVEKLVEKSLKKIKINFPIDLNLKKIL